MEVPAKSLHLRVMQFDTVEQDDIPESICRNTILSEMDEQLPYVESIHCDNAQRRWPIPLKCWCRGAKLPPLRQIANALINFTHPSSMVETERISETDEPENESKKFVDSGSENPALQFECSASGDAGVEDNMKNYNRIYINTKKKIKKPKKKLSYEVKSGNIDVVNNGSLNKKKSKKAFRSTCDVNNYSSAEDIDGGANPLSYDNHHKSRNNFERTSYHSLTGWDDDEAKYKLGSFTDFPSLSTNNNDSVQSEANNYAVQPSQRISKVFKELTCSEVVDSKPDKFIIENLPLELNKTILEQLLEGFGRVLQVTFHKVGCGLTATISMSPETDCNWIVQCLSGTYAFGANSQPLICYVVKT